MNRLSEVILSISHRASPSTPLVPFIRLFDIVEPPAPGNSNIEAGSQCGVHLTGSVFAGQKVQI
jgi:hypothetical protein